MKLRAGTHLKALQLLQKPFDKAVGDRVRCRRFAGGAVGLEEAAVSSGPDEGNQNETLVASGCLKGARPRKPTICAKVTCWPRS